MDCNGYLMSGNTIAAQIQNGRVTPLVKSRMPLYLAAGGDLETWLESRAIDRHRPNSRILKKVLRLTDSSDTAAVLRTHAATITDNYWIRLEEEPLTYDQVRFQEDTFAEIALTGSFASYSREYGAAQIGRGSPELTNIGSYEKCWRIENGGWWLYKSGNPLERFSEVFIANLGKLLGFSMADYLPVGEYIKTPDFTAGVYNYEPAEALVGDEEDYAFNYNRLTSLHPALGKPYLDILYMDALCFNMDRHTKNYGVLRNQVTGEVIGMAPNFDNNIALISRGYGTDPKTSNGMLIDLFADLLQKCGLAYQIPPLDKQALQGLVQCTLPEENIDREFVAAMVLERWQRLEQKIR